MLRLKSNESFHGIFYTFSPDFDVVLECCHKIDSATEINVYGRMLPRRADVASRFFERENIVDIQAYDVDKDFAAQSKYINFMLFYFFNFLKC